jgi:putative hemolysin
MDKPISDLRIATLIPAQGHGRWIRKLAPVIDAVIGLKPLQKLYKQHHLAGLNKQEFSQKLLQILGVKIIGEQAILEKIPATGRFIVVCNHPYGMIEGVIIARLLNTIRPDTKIMANVGLKMVKELNDYFIFANPLNPKAAINSRAIKQCFKHLQQDGLLVLFPAGRVAFYQSKVQRITDGEWNRLTIQLANKTKSAILPVFVSGTNSALFHRLGRIYYRFRLLMLARELLKLDQKSIALHANKALSLSQIQSFGDTNAMNDFVRLQCYLNDPNYKSQWAADDKQQTMKPIISASDGEVIANEIKALPEQQRLVEYKNFSVCCGFQSQFPEAVREITRLREITFRTLNEGSGEACDTDHFDATYMHLFIFDNNEKEIIGAYRIGLTDKLLQGNDISALYLSQMFNFSPQFINRQQPCMEMGRSFIIEKHQNSFYGLLLLWKGIGTFVCRNPQYKTLYGTVSLSKVYDPRSVALINEVMVSKTNTVTAHHPFIGKLHPEVTDYHQQIPFSVKQLSTLVQAIEDDGKDIPILLKQYHKLGATFHCLGIDDNFNQTPGLLLSVDLPKAPRKLLNLYMGEGAEQYLEHSNS